MFVPCSRGRVCLAVRLGGESGRARLLPCDLVGLDRGHVAGCGVEVDGGEVVAGGLQRGGGAPDDVHLRLPVSALWDVPGGDAAAPAPAVGLQDGGCAVTFRCALDEGSGLVGVGDRQHGVLLLRFLLWLVGLRWLLFGAVVDGDGLGEDRAAQQGRDDLA